MRLGLIVALAGAASLVSAAPIRIVILSTEVTSNTSFRPGPNEADGSANELQIGPSDITAGPVMHGCGRKGLPTKISDNVRQYVGLPPILGDGTPSSDIARIKPSQHWYKIAKDMDFAPARAEGHSTLVIAIGRQPVHARDSYPSRNGRLMSWVIGCGLVVLFRILWIVVAMLLTSQTGTPFGETGSEGHIRLSFDAASTSPLYPTEKSDADNADKPREKPESQENQVVRTA